MALNIQKFDIDSDAEFVSSASGYLLDADSIVNASLVLQGDQEAAFRLSQKLIECERNADKPHIVLHMLSLISLMGEIDYRAEPEHAEEWFEVLNFLDVESIRPQAAWVSKAFTWFKEAATMCKFALLVMEGVPLTYETKERRTHSFMGA